jgi:hypothetical protein
LAFVDFAPPIAAGIIGAATAIVAGQTANKNAERREARNREADEHPSPTPFRWATRRYPGEVRPKRVIPILRSSSTRTSGYPRHTFGS